MSRRLLQAIAGARHGGAETFFVRLALALQKAGETQRVLIRRDPERSHRLRSSGVKVDELAFGGLLDIATRLRFRREIATWRPHLVLTWMSRATQACPRGDFVHVARLGGYYDLKYYRRCDHLVGNTRGIVDYAVAQGWPPDRIDYLPNFVPDAGETKGRGHPRSASGPVALALGRLHPNKGFQLLIEALARTREARLALAGEGPLRGDLVRLARDCGVAGRVDFLGWRDDVPALLSQADFLVCPSVREPFGNVVVEAWSASLPVVAIASEGPSELIEDGINGLLVPPPGRPGGGAAGLAAAIERLSGDATLRQRLGRGGRRAYEAEFTEELVVRRYRHFFDQVTTAVKVPSAA
jgi:glycosyltransferase involved in cell wall biosynthesis